MISIVKSTTRRHTREVARSSSSSAATAAAPAAAAVKNSSAAFKKSNHFQNSDDDATFGTLNQVAEGAYEKVEKTGRKSAALQKQQPTSATPTAAAVSAVDRRITSITASTLSPENNDNHNHLPENPVSQTTAVAAVAAAAAATSEASAAAAAAAVVVDDDQLASSDGRQGEGGQQRPRPENIPKFVRVGSKVCFSTVVAAVLIPSSEDITAASKKELWWQATDYAEFRLNYAMLMQDPSLEKEDYDEKDLNHCDNYTNNNDENCYVGYNNTDCYNNNVGGVPFQGNENTVPYAVASVNEPHSAPGTAGYHYGGGVMCAPHGHVMAGRAQHVPTATVEGVLVVAAAPAPAVLASRPYPTNEMCGVGVGKQNGGGMFKGGQGRATKSTRNERAAWSRSNPSLDDQQQKLASRRHLAGGGGGGVAAPPAHRRHQGHGGQRVARVGNRPCYAAGRRDVRHDQEYNMQRGGINYQHGGAGGGQYFVNGYPAGVYDAPPPRAAYGNNSAQYGHGAAMAEAYLPVQQHQQRQHHVQGGGMIGGGGGAAYAPSSGGLGAPSVVMVQAPSSSQFSMWRSQLVFSPVMMQ